MRHLDVGTSWLQEKQLRKIIDMRKVPGLLNPGDLLTKHLSCERIDWYTKMVKYKLFGGRASAAAGRAGRTAATASRARRRTWRRSRRGCCTRACESARGGLVWFFSLFFSAVLA